MSGHFQVVWRVKFFFWSDYIYLASKWRKNWILIILKKRVFLAALAVQEPPKLSAIITMSFLGFWPLAIGLFPSKKSVIVAPRNNTTTSQNVFWVVELTVGWRTKAQCFCPPYLKTWFSYIVFNAELNGTIRILCSHRIGRYWPKYCGPAEPQSVNNAATET